MQNVLDLLQERGFVQDISDAEGLRRRLERPITLYWGYDATAPSLTLGHLYSLMMLSWFQRFDHRPIALAGGGTTLIGDPTGKQASRPMMTPEQIDENLMAIKPQMARFLNFDSDAALMLNNADWLTKLNFVEFMRQIGSRFSVNEILRLEAYRSRLEAGGLSFLEFSYVLVQSYDFLRLYQDFDCELQVGGSDQWGNSIAGADLIRRVTGDQGSAWVLVSPLILTSSGVKMGKSEAGAVWLDPERTSPYDYYQYWRNADDRDVERYLAIFTYLPMEEVRRLGSLQGADVNGAKETLAFEATRLLHGDDEAQRAQAAARSLFAGGEAADVPTVTIARSRLDEGMTMAELFREAGLVRSANEARNLIAQGGLSLNDEAVSDPRARLEPQSVQNGGLRLSRGRKQHLRILFQ